jgi:hypothetical protein
MQLTARCFETSGFGTALLAHSTTKIDLRSCCSIVYESNVSVGASSPIHRVVGYRLQSVYCLRASLGAKKPICVAWRDFANA